MSHLYHYDCNTPVRRENVFVPPRIADRLEELRAAIESESISYGEIAELQDLDKYIPDHDILLLQWAGVEEGIPRPGTYFCPECNIQVRPDALYSDRYQRSGFSILDIDSERPRESWIAVIVPDALSPDEKRARVDTVVSALNFREAMKYT